MPMQLSKRERLSVDILYSSKIIIQLPVSGEKHTFENIFVAFSIKDFHLYYPHNKEKMRQGNIVNGSAQILLLEEQDLICTSFQ